MGEVVTIMAIREIVPDPEWKSGVGYGDPEDDSLAAVLEDERHQMYEPPEFSPLPCPRCGGTGCEPGQPVGMQAMACYDCHGDAIDVPF